MLATHGHPTLGANQMLALAAYQNPMPSRIPVQDPMPTPARSPNQMLATDLDQMLVPSSVPPWPGQSEAGCARDLGVPVLGHHNQLWSPEEVARPEGFEPPTI